MATATTTTTGQQQLVEKQQWAGQQVGMSPLLFVDPLLTTPASLPAPPPTPPPTPPRLWVMSAAGGAPSPQK